MTIIITTGLDLDTGQGVDLELDKSYLDTHTLGCVCVWCYEYKIVAQRGIINENLILIFDHPPSTLLSIHSSPSVAQFT